MTATATTIAPPEPRTSLPKRMAWSLLHSPKRELWIAWTVMMVFYNLFGAAFFGLTHTQPPQPASWSSATIQQWFIDNRTGILFGFGLIFLVAGATAMQNALIAYSIRRMSVSRAFAYSYLVLYALATFPGMLFMCVAFSVGAMRPERSPEIVAWLYDMGYLSFSGTMGVFLIGSLVWMLAIILDKNGVFPKWFGYLNLCNAMTEIVVAPAWIFKAGPFAWNGAIAWWVNMVVYGIYAFTSFFLLFRVIAREDFGDGPLPDAPFRRTRFRTAGAVAP